MDICDIAQVAESMETFGARYLDRIYTPHELATCLGSPDSASRLGARFAAKEAVVKILRPTNANPDWRSIEVRSAADGSCSIVLSGRAEQLAAAAGLSDIAVSLTHEGAVSAAVVVAISVPEQRTPATKAMETSHQ